MFSGIEGSSPSVSVMDPFLALVNGIRERNRGRRMEQGGKGDRGWRREEGGMKEG
jgi:hypothetical protein